jgi:hypothetical protein
VAAYWQFQSEYPVQAGKPSRARTLPDPDIGRHATSVREELGYVVTPEVAKIAVHSAVEYVFNGAAVTTLLSARELRVLG